MEALSTGSDAQLSNCVLDVAGEAFPVSLPQPPEAEGQGPAPRMDLGVRAVDLPALQAAAGRTGELFSQQGRYLASLAIEAVDPDLAVLRARIL